MTQVKKPKLTQLQLERRVIEAESQQAHRLAFASSAIEKASTSHLMASGVILQLTVLGGREVMEPVCIRDGLSQETIAAIQGDLARSYHLATLIKPKVVSE